MINNTNLDFFDGKQKAELFRLKGVFLTSLGAKQEANNAYSQAVQVGQLELHSTSSFLLENPTKRERSTPQNVCARTNHCRERERERNDICIQTAHVVR